MFINLNQGRTARVGDEFIVMEYAPFFFFGNLMDKQSEEDNSNHENRFLHQTL
jgi:hypothetical protein